MSQEAWLAAICLTLLIVGINVGLLILLRGHSTKNQYSILSRAARKVRRPWQEEDDRLEELSRRVADLKDAPGMQSPEKKDDD